MTFELSSKYKTEMPESFVGAQQGLGALSETKKNVEIVEESVYVFIPYPGSLGGPKFAQWHGWWHSCGCLGGKSTLRDSSRHRSPLVLLSTFPNSGP